MNVHKLRLDEDDFNALVRGEVIYKDYDDSASLKYCRLEVILADIGVSAIVKAIAAIRPQRRTSDVKPYCCYCGERYETIEEFIECRKNHPKTTPPKTI